MKFVSYLQDKHTCLGLVIAEDRVLNLSAALAGTFGPDLDLIGLIAQGDSGLAAVRDAQQNALIGSSSAALQKLADIRLTAPIPRPAKNIFCVGRNYQDHIAEAARARGTQAQNSEVPTFFTKPPTSVTGPYDDVPLHQDITSNLDYEAELGVIIGRKGTNISREQALDYVFGYTVINDITARDVQRQHGQWFKGKGLDGSCPMGPWVVHASMIADPQSLNLTLTVNDEIRQSDSTSNMLFDIREIIFSLSAGLTLEPGDVIATGTPSGVGFAMKPPCLLKDGDIIRTKVSGVGELINRIHRS